MAKYSVQPLEAKISWMDSLEIHILTAANSNRESAEHSNFILKYVFGGQWSPDDDLIIFEIDVFLSAKQFSVVRSFFLRKQLQVETVVECSFS